MILYLCSYQSVTLKQSLDNKSVEPCKTPEFWEIQNCIDVPILLHSVWVLLSNTLFPCTIDYMYFFQFLPISSSFFQKKLEEIPFFQFLPFFPKETCFFWKFPNPAFTSLTSYISDIKRKNKILLTCIASLEYV